MIYYDTFNGTPAAINPDHISTVVKIDMGLRVEMVNGQTVLLRGWTMDDLKKEFFARAGIVQLNLSASQQAME